MTPGPAVIFHRHSRFSLPAATPFDPKTRRQDIIVTPRQVKTALVILSEAKDLEFSRIHEILRLRRSSE